METSKDVKMNSPLEALGGVFVGMMKTIINDGADRLKVERDHQNAIRVEAVRSSILKGKRYNMDELRSELQLYDMPIETLASELVLSVEVVKRAHKRFYYF